MNSKCPKGFVYVGKDKHGAPRYAPSGSPAHHKYMAESQDTVNGATKSGHDRFRQRDQVW